MENQNNTQNVEYVDEGISLQDLLMIIKKNLIAIIVFFVAFTAVGFAFGKRKKHPAVLGIKGPLKASGDCC